MASQYETTRTTDAYGGEVVDGVMYGRGVAVSKSDFATYAFALQIYGDFAGYSDVARGSSRLLGIELPIEDDHVAARLPEEDRQGSYRFYLATDENQGKPRHVRLKIEDRRRGQVVTEVESVLRAAYNLQQSGTKLNPTEMREMAVLQLAFKHGQLTDPTQEKVLSKMKKTRWTADNGSS